MGYTAHAAVIESITKTLMRTLKRGNIGRYTREDSITQQVLLPAATSQTDSKTVLESICRLLQTSVKPISKAVARNKDAALEERPQFFVDAETSCNAYDPIWAESATECLDDLTRAPE